MDSFYINTRIVLGVCCSLLHLFLWVYLSLGHYPLPCIREIKLQWKTKECEENIICSCNNCKNISRYYSRDDAEDSVKYISGTILDDRPIRVDFDWGFQEGRQWGRGRSGGQVISSKAHPFILRYILTFDLIYIFFQVRDEYRTDYDPDILLFYR